MMLIAIMSKMVHVLSICGLILGSMSLPRVAGGILCAVVMVRGYNLMQGIYSSSVAKSKRQLQLQHWQDLKRQQQRFIGV